MSAQMKHERQEAEVNFTYLYVEEVKQQTGQKAWTTRVTCCVFCRLCSVLGGAGEASCGRLLAQQKMKIQMIKKITIFKSSKKQFYYHQNFKFTPPSPLTVATSIRSLALSPAP